jgi:hypothetical protein
MARVAMDQRTRGKRERCAMKSDKSAPDGKGQPALERVVARLAIQASKAEANAAGGPVTPEQLHALRAGRLSRSERERLLAALDADREAFADWLAFNAALDEDNRARRPSGHRRALWGGIAGAAALLLLLIVWLAGVLPGPPIAEQVADAYRRAEDLGLLPADPPAAGSGRPEVRFGFHAPAPSSAQRALAAGARQGNARVCGRAERQSPLEHPPADAGEEARLGAIRGEEDLRTYAAFGRWLVLLEALCRSARTLPAAYWDDQRALAVRFGAAFQYQAEEEPLAAVLARQLTDIQDRLRHLAADPAAARTCADLMRQVAVTLARAGQVGAP